MTRRRIHRLPGMRDVTAHAYQRITQVSASLRDYLAESGYAPIDTPLLEETELFVRKSGGELTGRLYTFTDPGGHKVSLRPEFTSSVIRHFIQERESLTLPVRWQYSGPVFRYEHAENRGYRQLTQLGAELVGAAGSEADAETLSLTWSALERIGMRKHRLRVGHLGVLNEALRHYSLSESAKLFLIGNVQGLKSGSLDASALKERAEEMGLLREAPDLGPGAALSDLNDEAVQGFIQGVLKGSVPSPIGGRTSEQIVARLLRKVRDADDPIAFEDAVALIVQLVRLDGPPGRVLTAARSVASGRKPKVNSLDVLERMMEALLSSGVAESQVTLDLGLARGFAYYTGVIFELTHADLPSGVSLGGGGRYDGLVKALGGDEGVPALGFAYALERVVDALDGVSKPVSQEVAST